jgi:hypothetical protein
MVKIKLRVKKDGKVLFELLSFNQSRLEILEACGPIVPPFEIEVVTAPMGSESFGSELVTTENTNELHSWKPPPFDGLVKDKATFKEWTKQDESAASR